MYYAVAAGVFFAVYAFGEQPVVDVWLPVATNRDVDQALRRARLIVNEAYHEIGVSVVWRSAHGAPPRCSLDASHRTIIVAFASITPAGVSKEALAFATPFATGGPCVTMLMDRITPSAQTNPVSTGFLLGNALAHEIGHVLQGLIRHSDTGLMKARWSFADVRMMRAYRLHFEADDAEMIRRKLTAQTTLELTDRNAAAKLDCIQFPGKTEEIK